jgi:hypothetical protein
MTISQRTDRLKSLGLQGMAQAWQELQAQSLHLRKSLELAGQSHENYSNFSISRCRIFVHSQDEPCAMNRLIISRSIAELIGFNFPPKFNPTTTLFVVL